MLLWPRASKMFKMAKKMIFFACPPSVAGLKTAFNFCGPLSAWLNFYQVGATMELVSVGRGRGRLRGM